MRSNLDALDHAIEKSSGAVRRLAIDGGWYAILEVPRTRDEDAWCDRALADCASRPWSIVVLHDVLPHAMRHLERFIDSARSAGHEFTLQYPPDCVPIVAGHVTGDLSGIVARSKDQGDR